jgi:uncharacterized protein (TIGR03435 family)
MILALVGTSFACSALSAQQFDVVSVKPSSLSNPTQRSAQIQPGGRIRFIGMPLSMIIMPAYQVWDFQISGGPAWLRTEPWDIVAAAEGVHGILTIDQLRPLLRSLLEDRFQLKVHRETKLLPGYALVVDKRGSKLQPNTGGKSSIKNGKGLLVAKKEGMVWFIGWLSQALGRTVIDKTGLRGEFDFSLEWTPGPTENLTIVQPPATSADAALPDSAGPSLFTALQEQLGLRLDSQRTSTDVIVIDSAQRPSSN